MKRTLTSFAMLTSMLGTPAAAAELDDRHLIGNASLVRFAAGSLDGISTDAPSATDLDEEIHRKGRPRQRQRVRGRSFRLRTA